MAEARKQHFVPQFYLRGFAQRGETIHVFDKATLKEFPANVRDVASANYFYDLPEGVLGKEGIQLPEKALSAMEGRLKPGLDAAVDACERGEPLDRETRSVVALFMAVQFVRTLEHRASVKEMAEKVGQALADELVAEEFPDAKPGAVRARYSDEAAALQQLRHIFDKDTMSRYGAYIMGHSWILGRNVTNAGLWTSDHPVVLRPHKHDPVQSHAGLASPGIEIAFPLSPKWIVIAYERTFHVGVDKVDGRILDLGPDHVTYYNALQVQQSTRQVFAGQSAFELARRVCAENPEIRPRDRQRVDMGVHERSE